MLLTECAGHGKGNTMTVIKTNEYSSNNARIHYENTGLEIKINGDFCDKMGSTPTDLVDLAESSDLETFLNALPYQETRADWEEAGTEVYEDIRTYCVKGCWQPEINEWHQHVVRVFDFSDLAQP